MFYYVLLYIHICCCTVSFYVVLHDILYYAMYCIIFVVKCCFFEQYYIILHFALFWLLFIFYGLYYIFRFYYTIIDNICYIICYYTINIVLYLFILYCLYIIA